MVIVRELDKLFAQIEYETLLGQLQGDITELVEDTRKVSEGSLFVCIKGAVYDSHEHMQEIVDKGAKVIVVDKDSKPAQEFLKSCKDKVTIVAVETTKSAIGYLAAAYYDHPADKLKVIGITGTKGKTTTSYMVKSILEHASFKVGLIGTIEITYGKTSIPSVNTTPGAFVLQEHFANMVEQGIQICVMEVSSQAFLLHRVDGFTFEIGIFTNISPDHIGPNEHDSFENYMECKSQLFKRSRYAVINGDDAHADYMLKAADCETITYGFGDNNDLQAYDAKLLNDRGVLGVKYLVRGAMDTNIRVNMPGTFSVYNSLCAAAICNRLNVNVNLMRAAIERAKVKGRIEMLKVPGEYTLMIDYAHNAMSLKALLESLREYNPPRLVVLFGCGGNRAKGRRYTMGSVAARYADLAIITSDNPRDEEPKAIIDDILAGYSMGMKGEDAEGIDEIPADKVQELIGEIDKSKAHFVEIDDRIEAIGFIMANAKKGDLVVLAGKGHEDYQIIKGEKHHLDEREVVAEITKNIKKKQEELDVKKNDIISF